MPFRNITPLDIAPKGKLLRSPGVQNVVKNFTMITMSGSSIINPIFLVQRAFCNRCSPKRVPFAQGQYRRTAVVEQYAPLLLPSINEEASVATEVR
jgi:hypothetical protein